MQNNQKNLYLKNNMTEEKNDYSPLINLATGLGTKKDATLYNIAIRPYYHYETYSIYYRSSWACRRVVEALPRLMCRKWGKFTFSSKSDKHLSEPLTRRHQDLKVRSKFKLAQFWANLHGRAYILIITNEDNYEQPINIYDDKIIDLLVIDKNKIYPEQGNGNFSKIYPKYYQMHSYEGIIVGTTHTRTRIHESRLLVFKGNELPDDEKIRENGSEASVLEPFINVWIRYFNSSASLSHLLNNIDIFVHYIDGFIELMQQGGEDATNVMQARLEANLLFRSSYRGYMADKSKELITYESRNLGGVAPISERMEVELIAASGLPKSILFGQFAAGLDASGKITGEQRYLNELIEEGQKDKFEDNLRQLNCLFWLEKNAPREPEGWGWKWHELYGESKKESAEIFKIYAEADKINAEAGVYSSREARSRHEENEFSSEIILNEESPIVEVPSVNLLTDGEFSPQHAKSATGEYPRGELRAKVTTGSIPGGAFRVLDDATPVKKVIHWQGYDIGLQYLPFEQRHGKTLKAGYGHFRNTIGADKMAVDAKCATGILPGGELRVYVGTATESEKIFMVKQLVDGMFDEDKMIIGVYSIEEAKALYLSAMPAEFMGEVEEISVEDLRKYRKDEAISGQVLSDGDYGKIAEFGDEDLELALNQWNAIAPDKYKGLLNAD